MKKNLTRKLALSAVTMGVAALTVTSTTYAWYTTNNTASASGMKTSAASANSNMLIGTKTISATGEGSTEATTISEAYWTNNATFVDKGNQKISPVQYYSATNTAAKESDTATTTTGWKKVDGSNAEATDVVTYKVWFSTTSLANNATYNLNMTVTSAIFSEKGSQILDMSAYNGVDETKKTNYSAGKILSVGLQDALSFKITKNGEYSGRTSSSGTVTYTPTTSSGIVTADDQYYRFLTEATEDADALYYYNQVTTGANLKRPTSNEKTVDGVKIGENTVSNYIDYSNSGNGIGGSLKEGSGTEYQSSTSVKIATISTNEAPGTTDVWFGLEITLFIDGWDYQCFNAISTTTLNSLNLRFDLEKENN